MHPSPAAPVALRRLNDAPLRTAHALMALCFLVAYVTAESEHWRLEHNAAGYGLLLAMAFRGAYGVWGPVQARWSGLWFRWRTAFRQATDLPRALLLSSVWGVLLLSLLSGLSGWLADSAWAHAPGHGVWRLVSRLHEPLSEMALLLVLAHLGLVLAVSVLRRTNHARLMWSGQVAGRGPSPVRDDRKAWALLLALVVMSACVRWAWP